MPDSWKEEVADAAAMIVNGYAFLKHGRDIQVVNLNKKEPHVMIINPSGKMLESSMDPIEERIAIDIWERDSEFMGEADA